MSWNAIFPRCFLISWTTTPSTVFFFPAVIAALFRTAFFAVFFAVRLRVTFLAFLTTFFFAFFRVTFRTFFATFFLGASGFRVGNPLLIA